MANFRTHLYGATAVSGVAALTLYGSAPVSEGQTLVLFGLGVLGGLLPDIDADASAPVRGLFGALGVALAFAWTLPLVGRYSELILASIWIGSFLAVRVLLYEVFARITVHRGIWHSLLAALFSALATANLLHWLLGQEADTAWQGALMVGIGYLTHLALDEAVGVNLLGARVKRSFGTAMKPLSFRDPASSLAMGVAVALLLWLAPPLDAGPGWSWALDGASLSLWDLLDRAVQAADHLWLSFDWR